MKVSNLNKAPVLENALGLDARVAASAQEAELVQFTLSPGEVIPPHPMPVRVFFIVLEGEGEITVDGYSEAATVNDVIEIEPGAQRGWKSVGKENLRVLAVKTPRPIIN